MIDDVDIRVDTIRYEYHTYNYTSIKTTSTACNNETAVIPGLDQLPAVSLPAVFQVYRVGILILP